MIGTFSLNGRSVRNKILAYGRRRMLKGALMEGSIELAWYIGLISAIDMSVVADNHTFKDKTWTEFTDYTVSGDGGVRPTWQPLAHNEQTVNDIVQYTETTLLYSGAASAPIRGLFLCDRIFKDDEEYNIFSIAEASVVETIYPGQPITVGYTVAYK